MTADKPKRNKMTEPGFHFTPPGFDKYLSHPNLWNPEVSKAIPPADVLSVLGRGVEKAGDRWLPTRYVQVTRVLRDENGAVVIDPKTERPRIVRTAERESCGNTDELSEKHLGKDKSLVVGGGEANVQALTIIYENLVNKGKKPKLVIFAAGSPFYLTDRIKRGVPGTPESEGAVMQPPFEAAVSGSHIEDKTLPRREIIARSNNTRDDLENALIMAAGAGLNKVIVINTTVAMPRTLAFYDDIITEKPSLANTETIFMTAENIILNYGFDLYKRALEDYGKLLGKLTDSHAWQSTWESEESGIRDIRAGTYGKVGKGMY